MARVVVAPGGYPREDRYPGQQSAPVAPPSLADGVTPESILPLMLERPSSLFQREDRVETLRQLALGVAAEVEPITGGVPTDPRVLALATWCVRVGTAAAVESSVFPNTAGGENARANYLRSQYLGVRAQLLQLVAESAPADGARRGGPSGGGFEIPALYPDRARRLYPVAGPGPSPYVQPLRRAW